MVKIDSPVDLAIFPLIILQPLNVVGHFQTFMVGLVDVSGRHGS